MSSRNALYALFLLPVFLTIESTRGVLFLSDNTTSRPWRFLVLVLNILAFGPLRVVLSWVAVIVSLPVRALLWFMGIGRGAPRKASAAATARYYEFKKRRAEALEEDTRARLRRV